MNVVEPLEGKRVDQLFLVLIEGDESMNRVINLLISVKEIFYHRSHLEPIISERPIPSNPKDVYPLVRSGLTLVDVGCGDLNELGLAL